MKEFKKISIITSCFNQEETVEDTIKSVVNQQYPNLEYIFIDGASTDNTLRIATKYKDNISWIISEPDDGQYYGIQKGLNMASGEIMAWLNGDDMYMPWTFSLVNEIFTQFKDVDWIIGTQTFFNKQGQCTKHSPNSSPAYPQKYIKNGWFRGNLGGYIQQESLFWRKGLWEKSGGFNLDLKYAADFELWTKFAEHAPLVSLDVPVAGFRQIPGEQRSSTGRDVYEQEVYSVCKNKEKPVWLWNRLSDKGIFIRTLCRCFIWKTHPVIAYSSTQRQWIKKNLFRPISKASFLSLYSEFCLRKSPKK